MVEKDPKVVDMVFKQKLEQQQAIRRKKKRKRNRKIIIFLLIVSTLSFYFMTDFSKPKAINIKGNVILTKDEVLKAAKVSSDSYLLIANPLSIKFKLKEHPLITNVKTNFSLFSRIINIEIDEIDLFGYRQSSEKSELILFNGTSMELTEDLYPFLRDLIYVEGFEEEEDQKRLVESFNNLDASVKNQISELHQTSVSYDEKLLEIWMSDGNKVYTSFQTVDRLNYYFDIIKVLDKDNKCLFIDEMSGEAYAQKCPE